MNFYHLVINRYLLNKNLSISQDFLYTIWSTFTPKHIPSQDSFNPTTCLCLFFWIVLSFFLQKNQKILSLFKFNFICHTHSHTKKTVTNTSKINSGQEAQVKPHGKVLSWVQSDRLNEPRWLIKPIFHSTFHNIKQLGASLLPSWIR